MIGVTSPESILATHLSLPPCLDDLTMRQLRPRYREGFCGGDAKVVLFYSLGSLSNRRPRINRLALVTAIKLG